MVENGEWQVKAPYGFDVIERHDNGVNLVPYNGISTSTDITRHGQLHRVACGSEAEGLERADERLELLSQIVNDPAPPSLFNVYSTNIKQLLRDAGPLNNKDVRAFAVPNPTPADPQHTLLLLGPGTDGNDIPGRQLSGHVFLPQVTPSKEDRCLIVGFLTAMLNSMPDWHWCGLVEFKAKGGAGTVQALEAESKRGGKPITPELQTLASILEWALESAADISPERLMQVDDYMALLGSAPSLRDFYLCLDNRDRMILRRTIFSYWEYLHAHRSTSTIVEEINSLTVIQSLDSFEGKPLVCEIVGNLSASACRQSGNHPPKARSARAAAA